MVVAFAIGCGGSPSRPQPAVANDPTYPAGPYGYGSAQAIPDLVFNGKIATTPDDYEWASWQMFALGEQRGPQTRLEVIEVSGAWCSDCINDQPAMRQLESDYSARGVVGMEVLVEGAFDKVATPDDLINWGRNNSVTGILLLDAQSAFEEASSITALPTYFLVDTSDMHILRRSEGSLATNPLGPTLDMFLAQ
jgi:hypothetical protein